MPAPEHQNDQTKERLLEEAERLFAEHGYEAVSVRVITKSAGCNLGAVNYHFGSKQNLYKAVFMERWIPRARKIHNLLEDLEKKGDTPPDKVIYTITSAYMELFSCNEALTLHHKLIVREMMNPSEIFEMVAQKAMLPTLELLLKLFKPHMPEKLFETRGVLFALSIFAQVLYFNFARFPISSATGREYDDEFKDLLARHLTDFSLHGLLHASEIKESTN
ncbi:TetR/AcrR family transcriptional regulator [Dethiosulfatarculus sandiegensis]|uniref:HTH tetR-type domain-containing protein n=1 Tax=Dethiosulfatarculus sandiegensis TaxID=1429043 RepID=A0A0D2HP75_9BACT|nr:TetR/AcrR family transcriptional regulator [Dethiosulfatarculus sandiegensis]KIX12328.1 hypothetical protein X474_20725 [Dethiosulfatarculus sandiegensis]